MADAHFHGTLVVADTHGVFVTGPSGAGKTALAFELLRYCAEKGRFARLISDDQVQLSVHHGRLIGRVPAAIAGLAEARLYGPAPVVYEPAAVVDLVVRLASDGESPPRLQLDETAEVEGISIPCLRCDGSDLAGAIRAIAARLRLPPFYATSGIID